jgi:hypothetical protein
LQRAYDAASDKAWLSKAKQSNEVIALGVNDISTTGRSALQLLGDLQTIVSILKGSRIDMSVILCTIPPYNLTDAQELVWRDVNQAIRSHAIAGVDRVFDIAEVLSQAAPRDNLIMPEYMSSEFDAHPNGKAGTAIASTFLAWY